jgi:hypothetical protein
VAAAAIGRLADRGIVVADCALAQSSRGWHEAYTLAVAAALAVLTGLRDAGERLAAADSN